MFIETIRSEGLAHLSYMIGDGIDAAVIDPRRDCQIYLDKARRRGVAITHIFETHRNEDLVAGSSELARRTGAEVYHGKALDFDYGKGVEEGERFRLGEVELRVLETPGHTCESISLVLLDLSFGGTPVGVFTGDALFVGDVGRTDLVPDKEEEMTGRLYESVFDKLLPLGDQTLLWPAHGSGSVCGGAIASREISTIGYERRHNPALQFTGKDDFIRERLKEQHYRPPYFDKMKEYNLKGNAPDLASLSQPRAMNPEQFAEALDQGMQVLDIRSPEAFSGAFIPKSLAIPLDLIPSFAGWFLDYARPIGLVPGNGRTQDRTTKAAVRALARVGYDDVVGYLADGLHSWETSARCFGQIPAIHAQELNNRIKNQTKFTLLDVRERAEYEAGHLPNAKHIYVGDLPNRLDTLPDDESITTFCGSGRRAIIAASILKRHGFTKLDTCLGSMAACSTYGCPVEKEGDAA